MTSNQDQGTQIEVDFTTSPGFSAFLASLRVSLVISTYQTGNVFFIGPDQDDRLAISPIRMPRPMGMCISGQSIYIGGKREIVRFNNILPAGATHEGADRLFLPHTRWTIADMDAHDIVREKSGRTVFVNTLYSCLATLSEDHTFCPLWRPPPIKELQPEDRCHLNGLALRDGVVTYATAFSTTNTKQGWREHKDTAGVIWNVRTNQIVLDKLSMPHSPRWHDNRLWCLESGTGRFGTVNLEKKTFSPLVELPGYLRGLTFHGDFAFIGSSIPRAGSVIKHSKLESSIATKGQVQTCGIFIVNLKLGKVVHSVRISGAVQEVYDVAVLTNTFRPRAESPESEALDFMLNIGPEQALAKG
jgi:uncharacterized protein (TIGR03032 family)